MKMIKISRCENYALRTECSLSSHLWNVLSVFFIITSGLGIAIHSAEAPFLLQNLVAMIVLTHPCCLVVESPTLGVVS